MLPNLQRPEPPLVIHLRMPGDPEAKVDVRNATSTREFHLLQDAEGAESARFFIGIEERIDSRYTREGDVGHGDAEEAIAEVILEEEGRAPWRRQEALKIFLVRPVHAAAAVACPQVALVEVMPVGRKAGDTFADRQVGVALEAATLGAIGGEAVHVDAAGHAGLAGAALGEVEVPAGAAETLGERRAVQLVEIRRAGIDHEVLRRPLGEVAAGVRQGLEQADAVGHGDVIAPMVGRRHGGSCG